MSPVRYFVKAINTTTRAINVLSTGTVFVIMMLIIIGIIARFFGLSLTGIINLSESLLVVAVYMAVAYTQQAKQHVAVDFFVSRLSERKRKILAVVSISIALFVCAALILTSWDYALASWRIREKMDGTPFYPIYPPKIAIAVGVSLLWLQLLADLFVELASFFRSADTGQG